MQPKKIKKASIWCSTTLGSWEFKEKKNTPSATIFSKKSGALLGALLRDNDGLHNPERRRVFLVGGWTNPSEKICSSKWESSPSRDENKKYLKPPPSFCFSWGDNVGIFSRELGPLNSNVGIMKKKPSSGNWEAWHEPWNPDWFISWLVNLPPPNVPPPEIRA